jgi:cytochrome b561
MRDGASTGMPAMKSYGPIARTFHWGFIGIFLYGIIKQVDDISQLEDSALLRFEVLFALLFLAVLAGRFIYMTKTQTSALLENTSRFQR